jgi:hypothetical protein
LTAQLPVANRNAKAIRKSEVMEETGQWPISTGAGPSKASSGPHPVNKTTIRMLTKSLLFHRNRLAVG